MKIITLMRRYHIRNLICEIIIGIILLICGILITLNVIQIHIIQYNYMFSAICYITGIGTICCADYYDSERQDQIILHPRIIMNQSNIQMNP